MLGARRLIDAGERAGRRVVRDADDPAAAPAVAEEGADRRGEVCVGRLPAAGVPEAFHAIVCAGNVMTFLAESTRLEVLRRMRAHVRDDGRAAIGFGAGRGYEFADFLSDAAAAGWAPDLLLSTWDLRPFTDDADFLVALLRPA